MRGSPRKGDFFVSSGDIVAVIRELKILLSKIHVDHEARRTKFEVKSLKLRC